MTEQQGPGNSGPDVPDLVPFSILRGRDIPAELFVTRMLRDRSVLLEEDPSFDTVHRIALTIGFCVDAIEDLEKRIVELGRRLEG